MPPRERLLTLPFALASVANFLQGMALHGYLHLPGFLEELGADEVMVGLVFGLMSGAAITIRPFAGRVMDRAGRRWVILGGGVIHVASCALYLTVETIGPWLFFVRALQGFAVGALFSSLFTYAADIVPASRRTEGIGLFGVSGMLPISLGGLLGDAVLARGTYRDLFAVSAVLAVVALLASLPLKEAERPRGVFAGKGFFSALTQRDLLPLWFVGSAFASGLAAFLTFVKSFVIAEGIGSVGLFFSTYAAAAIALRLLFGWVPDRYGPKRVLYPSMAFIALGLWVMAGARDGLGVGLAGALAGLGHGFAFPIVSTLVVERANPADRGSAVSLFTAVFDAGVFLGGPALGVVARFTDLRAMFVVAAFVPSLGAVIFHFWDRRVQEAATSTA